MKLNDARNLKAYVYFHYDLPNGDHMSEKAVVNCPVIALQSHPLCCTELSFKGPLESWVDQKGKQENLFAPEAARNIELYVYNSCKSNKSRRETKENKEALIKRVIFCDPMTKVLWSDGTETIVHCQDGESYDWEKGLALCISKKFLGNNGDYYDIFCKLHDDYEVYEKHLATKRMKKKLAKAVKKKAKKGKKK